MEQPLIKAENLKKYFKTPKGMLHAVEGVSFAIEKGTTLGVVGESGCGKSTLARLLAGLDKPTDGSILYNGKPVGGLGFGGKNRRNVQMIFQDPLSSLDPRMCAGDIIGEPLKIHFPNLSRRERENKVVELMESVGLGERYYEAYPNELDGGCRQRIGIARALATEPGFVVCDEPVSALDVSVRAQILNLMQQLKKQRGLTYMFITHDMAVVRHMSDKIMVMYLGCIMELADGDELFEHTLHPYTKGLIAAIPVPDVHAPKQQLMLRGELLSPIDPPQGCRFAPRCPFGDDICRTATPIPKEIRANHFVACHKC